MAGFAFSVMINVSVAVADTESSVAGESTKPTGRTEIVAGVISSDIGGGKRLGPAICINAVKEYSNSRILLRFGLEYSRKSGTGEVTHQNTATGELLYRGQADVSLHYLQTTLSMGYYLVRGKFDIAPYFGLGPALLVNQEINPVEPAQAGAFKDYRGYSSFEFLALGGVAIRYSRLVFDFQLAKGLLDLENSDGGLVGGSSNGSALLDGNSKSRSFRFALGYSF